MKILVLNCGSSSIKYQLFDMTTGADVIAKGIIERVGLENAELKHEATGKEKHKSIHVVPDHTIGIDLILKTLMDPVLGVIKDKYEIKAVGHRVVHGGETFSGSVMITKAVVDKMEECVDLAPLHNPANLKGIYAMRKLLPDVPMVAVFDTSFHQSMPSYSYMYPIPYAIYKKDKVRRYGFHGTSHYFVSQRAYEEFGIDKYNSKVITCHLGNGSSITAVLNGQSVDTSMGMTPVEGLMMGTRVGDLDAGALLYIMTAENLNLTEINMLNLKNLDLNQIINSFSIFPFYNKKHRLAIFFSFVKFGRSICSNSCRIRNHEKKHYHTFHNNLCVQKTSCGFHIYFDFTFSSQLHLQQQSFIDFSKKLLKDLFTFSR